MTSIEHVVRDFLEGYGLALSTGDLPGIVNCWDVPRWCYLIRAPGR